MATIRKAESGWWQAIVRRKNHKVQSKTYEKKSDAEEWARDIETQMDRNIFTDRSEAEKLTLDKALEKYEKEVTALKDGKEIEEVRIKVWRKHDLAKRSVASLKPADFAEWLDVRLKDVSPATTRKELAIISHLYTVMQKRWGINVDNPILKIEIPSEDNSRDRRLEEGEEAALLAVLAGSCSDAKRENIYMLPLVILAIETAMRQSELLALKWVDVDKKKPVVRVRGKDRADGRSRTKTREKYRDVPLSPRAIAVLEGMPRSIGGSVFPTTTSAVKQSFVRAVARAGKAYKKECESSGVEPRKGFMENLTFHDLRHEATSRLAEKLQMHELMKVTGHAGSRMLARYYHPRAEDLAKKLA